MNKQTEDKIKRCCSMYMRKAPELILLTCKKMVLSGGLSVVAELGP